MAESISASFKLLIFIGFIAVIYSRGAPPRFIKPPKLLYVASVGDRVKLKCLVTGTKDPMHNRTYSVWIYYGQGSTSVIRKTWRRFKYNGKHLRISNVKLKDAGKYLCLAHNTHGRINATMELIVRENGNTSVFNTQAVTVTPPPKAKGRPPVFRGRKKTFHYYGRAGVPLKLRCSADGFPKPKIRWYLKNKRLSPRMKDFLVSNGWALRFPRLHESHRGRYMCEVRNQYGTIRKIFIIRPQKGISQSTTPRLDPDVPLPVIQKHLLKNITAESGSDVIFTCTAQSQLLPRFNWLRWNPILNESLINATNTTSMVRVLNSSEPRVRFIRESSHWDIETKQIYIHKLKVLNVSDADQGRYTCVVGSEAGFVSSDVYLSLRPRKETPPQDTEAHDDSKTRKTKDVLEIPLAALIAVPVAFGTILIVAIVWCYVQMMRHRARLELKAKTVSFAVDSTYGRHACADKMSLQNGGGAITVNRLDELTNLEKRLAQKGETELTVALKNGDVRIENGFAGSRKPCALHNGTTIQNGGLKERHIENLEPSDNLDRVESPVLQNGGPRRPLRTQNSYVQHYPVIDRVPVTNYSRTDETTGDYERITSHDEHERDKRRRSHDNKDSRVFTV